MRKLSFFFNYFLFFYFLFNTWCVQAQSKIIAKDESAIVEEIGHNIFTIIHNDATDEWPHGNTGIIVGSKGVLVIDADYLPSRSKADIKLIKKLTSMPVKYLAITHWHMDHTNGAICYLDEYPDLKIINPKESSVFITINQEWYAKSSSAPNSLKRQSLEKLKNQLASGKDTLGNELNDSLKKNLSKIIAQRQNEIEELEQLRSVKPNMTFSGQMKLDLGDKIVQIKDWGKANSPEDVSFYLPSEKILFTGDMLVETPLPFVGACWPVTWVNTLQQIDKIPLNIIIPGHGPVMYNKEYLHQFQHFLQDCIKRVTEMIYLGKTLLEIQHSNFDDLRTGVWRAQDVTDEDWSYTISVLVERIWRGVRGQG